MPALTALSVCGIYDRALLTLKPPVVQNAEGSGLGPFDCWLALRGVKTMALRMERSAATAATLAAWLQAHPLVRRINYPGLAGHPGAGVHAAQATAGGSLLSFETGRCARLFHGGGQTLGRAHATQATAGGSLLSFETGRCARPCFWDWGTPNS